MIKKFIKIAGTGKYLNYAHASIPAPHRTTDFEKINLIYGENGIGKTTLSLILQSLRGDNNLLSKKRSFDRSVAQAVEVLTDHGTTPKFTFENSRWDNHYPHIEIFDVHFINDNIFTGHEVGTSHKKNLFEIIFGQQGIQLKNDIQGLKENIANEQRLLTGIEGQLTPHTGGAYKLPNYISLQVDSAIDEKINLKEQEINIAKNFEEIQRKGLLETLQLVPLPVDQAVAANVIGKSIDTISEKYLATVKNHVSHLALAQPHQWLKDGLAAAKEESCPFCMQSLSGVELVIAYRDFFSAAYNQLLAEIADIIGRFNSYNTEAIFERANAKMRSNELLADYWRTHINEASLSAFSIEGKRSELLRAVQLAKEAVQRKSENPINAGDFQPVGNLFSLIEEVNQMIETYNSEVRTFNGLASILKARPMPNLNALNSDLAKLHAHKRRGEAAVAQLCASYTTKANLINTLNTTKGQKQGQLDTYSTSVFNQYSTKINHYLRAFAPYLQIGNLDSQYVGRSTEPIVKYVLQVSGNEIAFEENSAAPNFKYSLSEGDKSALALAFFFSRVELNGNLQDKIIVFDDPVSSFDLNRKSVTVSKLLSLGEQAKQLIVLTHNLLFATDFWRLAQSRPSSKQCSKIEFVGNTSSIIEYKIDVDNLSSIIKDSIALKTYLNEGALTDDDRRKVARCIRPALESYFHLKFFDVVADNEWLGDFIGKVRNATSTDSYHRLQPHLTDLNEVNEYSKRYHHREGDAEPINDAELRAFCQRALDLIQVI